MGALIVGALVLVQLALVAGLVGVAFRARREAEQARDAAIRAHGKASIVTGRVLAMSDELHALIDSAHRELERLDETDPDGFDYDDQVLGDDDLDIDDTEE